MTKTGSILLGIYVALISTSLATAGDVLLHDDFATPGLANWTHVGRGSAVRGNGILRVSGGYVAAGDHNWTDYELKFSARAPADAPEAQIWCGVRAFDNDRRYAIGLRGGNNQQLYIIRYTPYGQDRFFGRRALPFKVVPGTWYTLRVRIVGTQLAVYLNDARDPYLSVSDTPAKEWEPATFHSGQAVLGGGYLPTEFRDVTVTSLPADTVLPAIVPPVESPERKEQRRTTQRAAYQPMALADTHDQSKSLNGNWLFWPDTSFVKGVNYADPKLDDSRWHVMDVPNFWTPRLNWLFGEQARYNGPFMGDKGISDNYWDAEQARCDAYTFDWHHTKAAWYRQHLLLPADLGDQRYELQFDAIAKISQIFVNGNKVSTNVGMFREIKNDITSYLHGGDNVIAVYDDTGEKRGHAADDDNKIAGIAITVEVTNKMLNSLPAGMYRGTESGIWQPVTLNVTGKTYVSDVYFKSRLDGASIDVEVSNSSKQPRECAVAIDFTSLDDNSPLPTPSARGQVLLAAGETKTLTLDTGPCTPKLWTPDLPHLYRMNVNLTGEGVHNTRTLDIGFRTFVVSGRRFLLNGKPYWLRGANHTPMPEKPNDAALADRFLQLAHDNNVRLTRSHTCPYDEMWLNAADRIGVGVSYEGIWPWLMLEGGLPEKSLLADWKGEWLGLLHKYRNHPSILLWTVNNEMHLDRAKDHDLAVAKFAVLSDAIHGMRAIDPTRPIVADSGYTRSETMRNYDDVIKPNHIDDGDIDDFHSYPAWYNPSFYFDYSFAPAAHGRLFANTGRPLITQEFSTGYSRIDDGLPTRFYTLDNMTPIALVGDDSYETADPAVFLSRLAVTTQMAAEAARRQHQPSDEMAGTMSFSLVTWFHNAMDAKRIEPFAPIYSLKRALQPVLISAEMYGWNYYAGSQLPLKVSIINDSADAAALPTTRLEWSIVSGGQTLSHGSNDVAPVPYYGSSIAPMTIMMPATLSTPRVRAAIHLDLFDGTRRVASNEYPILLATPAWAGLGAATRVSRFDPQHRLDGLCEKMHWSMPTVARFGDALADPNKPVLIADFAWANDAASRHAFDAFLGRGGRALLYQPGEALPAIAPQSVASFRPADVEIATAHVAGSPIVADIEPNEIAWFTRTTPGVPVAVHGDFQLKNPLDSVNVVLQDAPIHGYLKPNQRTHLVGAAVFPVHHGRGVAWVTQLAHEQAGDDPVAARLLAKLLERIDRPN